MIQSIKNWLHIRNKESLLGLLWVYCWTLGLHCALQDTVRLGTCNKVLQKEMLMINSICNSVVWLGETEWVWSLGEVALDTRSQSCPVPQMSRNTKVWTSECQKFPKIKSGQWDRLVTGTNKSWWEKPTLQNTLEARRMFSSYLAEVEPHMKLR